MTSERPSSRGHGLERLLRSHRGLLCLHLFHRLTVKLAERLPRPHCEHRHISCFHSGLRSDVRGFEPVDGAEPEYFAGPLVQSIEASRHQVAFWRRFKHVTHVWDDRQLPLDVLHGILDAGPAVDRHGAYRGVQIGAEVPVGAVPVLNGLPNLGVGLADDVFSLVDSTSHQHAGVVVCGRVVPRPQRRKCLLDSTSDPFDQSCVIEECHVFQGTFSLGRLPSSLTSLSLSLSCRYLVNQQSAGSLTCLHLHLRQCPAVPLARLAGFDATPTSKAGRCRHRPPV